jgi:hypothetical protein
MIPVIVFKGVASDNMFQYDIYGKSVFGGEISDNTIMSYSAFTNILVTDALYSCRIEGNTSGSFTIDGRMTGSQIIGNNNCTFKGWF